MRAYDTRVGRFFSVDPLARQYPYYTPYQFAGNKPIRYIDRDGLEEADHGSNWFIEFFFGSSPPPLTGDLQSNRQAQNRLAEWQANKQRAAVSVQTATNVVNAITESLVSGVDAAGMVPGLDVVTDPMLAAFYGATGNKAQASIYTAGILIPGVGGSLLRKAGDGLNYVLKKTDVDLRGTGTAFRDVLDAAFEKTGIDKEAFEVTKWGKTAEGKSMPVEFRAQGGAEVSIDFAHKGEGMVDAPHVGWQTPGKRGDGGGQRGHIIVDQVPAGR